MSLTKTHAAPTCKRYKSESSQTQPTSIGVQCDDVFAQHHNPCPHITDADPVRIDIEAVGEDSMLSSVAGSPQCPVQEAELLTTLDDPANHIWDNVVQLTKDDPAMI